MVGKKAIKTREEDFSICCGSTADPFAFPHLSLLSFCSHMCTMESSRKRLRPNYHHHHHHVHNGPLSVLPVAMYCTHSLHPL